MISAEDLKKRFPDWTFRVGQECGAEIVAFLPGFKSSVYIDFRDGEPMIFAKNAPVEVIKAVHEYVTQKRRTLRVTLDSGKVFTIEGVKEIHFEDDLTQDQSKKIEEYFKEVPGLEEGEFFEIK